MRSLASRARTLFWKVLPDWKKKAARIEHCNWSAYTIDRR